MGLHLHDHLDGSDAARARLVRTRFGIVSEYLRGGQVPTVVIPAARCSNHGLISLPKVVTPSRTTMATAAMIMPYSTTFCPR